MQHLIEKNITESLFNQLLVSINLCQAFVL